MNFHAVLGIPRNADDEAIRRAYRTLVRRYHPVTTLQPMPATIANLRFFGVSTLLDGQTKVNHVCRSGLSSRWAAMTMSNAHLVFERVPPDRERHLP